MNLQNDLTTTTLSYVDRHLAIALLDTMQTRKSPYSEESLVKAQFTLCTGTQLYSDLIDLAEEALPEKELENAQNEYKAKQEALASERERILLGEGVANYKAFLAADDNKLRYEKMCDDQSITSRGLEAFGLKEENLRELFAFANGVYQYGQYGECRSILRFLSQVKPSQYRLDEKRMWGQLACEILCAKHGIDGVKWQDAIRSLNFIVDSLDVMKRRASTVLHCLHWSLFTHLLSEVPQGRDELLDLLLTDKCFPYIFSQAQHLLRYVIVCVMTTRGVWLRGNVHGHPIIRELTRVLSDVNFEYSDPVISLFEAMFVKCDAKQSVEVLPMATATVQNDVFVQAYADEFISAARRQIFEDHCKTHGRVGVQEVASSLGIAPGDAEKWIVNVLRNSKISGKIREEGDKVCVVSDRTSLTIPEIIAEKTKAIAARLQSLVNCNT